MTPYDYCANKIGGPGSDLYYSLLFLPTERRQVVNAVYAFVRETGEIADECSDPSVAHAKLNWWREEIQRTYAGAPRHPITQTLAPGITQYQFEREHFVAILDASAATVGRVRIENLELLRMHCHGTGSIPGLLAGTAFGLTEPATRIYTEILGLGLRLTEILSYLGHDTRRDRLYLPATDLRRFGVSETDILAGRHTLAFATLMRFEVDTALHYLDDALTELPHADRAHQLPGLVMAALARAQLDEIRRDGYRVLERHLALTPLRKLWIAWRTRAREWRHTQGPDTEDS